MAEVGARRRILVTGGAGFLGSHLVDRLLAAGHEVLCVDTLLTGARSNIAHLDGEPRFQFLHHDVCDPLDAAVDEIYNLACPASPIHYQLDPVRTTRTSVQGAINMLDLARHRDCRIFQASTSEVYGDPAVNPQTEAYWGNVNAVGLRACYTEGKRCAETLFFDYRRQHRLDIKVARIFNAYGPRMRSADGRVVSNFIVQALTGAPITIYGNGRQTRSFCYVDDMIEGFVRFMASPADFPGPLNIGNPEEIAMADLADLVIELTGSASTIEYRPLPEDDPMRRVPDIALAKRSLGWAPRVGLREGLMRTIEDLRRSLAETEPAAQPRAARA